MKLSVVIPTFNRLRQLQQVLAGLAVQTYSPGWFEVIVVSDGSTDGTNEYLERARLPFQLRPVFKENGGVATARNRGVAEAKGELLLFLDDDVVPASHLIEEHLRSHDRQGKDVVVLGPMLTPDDHQMHPWVSWEQQMLVKQYDAMDRGQWEATARQFYTGNTSVARHWLEKVGGFDPTFRRAEDVELAYRLAAEGVHFIFNSDAVGYHYAVRSFDSWMATPYAYGRNDVLFTRDKGQRWLLPTILYEFHGRNLLVRGLTRLCLDRPRLSRSLIEVLHRAGQVTYSMGRERLSRMAYSGIFNLRHYQGVADELGGRSHFFDGVARYTSKPAEVPGAVKQRGGITISEGFHE